MIQQNFLVMIYTLTSVCHAFVAREVSGSITGSAVGFFLFLFSCGELFGDIYELVLLCFVAQSPCPVSSSKEVSVSADTGRGGGLPVGFLFLCGR